jgi:PleD family two-component response regulator
MYKVLLIEDDEILLRMYRRLLLYKGGYEVEIAENAKTGFAKAKNFKPDIIFLDVIMPDMNGLELLKKLKKTQETKNVPVILLTNLGVQKELDKAIKDGAARYIIKNDSEPNEILLVAKEVLVENSRRQAAPKNS